MLKRPSAAELETAIRAVTKLHSDFEPDRFKIGESWVTVESGERWVHFDAAPYQSLAKGEVYTTWIVRTKRGQIMGVDYFCSRACSTGADVEHEMTTTKRPVDDVPAG